MTISKWLIALICTAASEAAPVATLAIHRYSESPADSDLHRHPLDAEAAFEARPNTRGGVKGY